MSQSTTLLSKSNILTNDRALPFKAGLLNLKLKYYTVIVVICIVKHSSLSDEGVNYNKKVLQRPVRMYFPVKNVKYADIEFFWIFKNLRNDELANVFFHILVCCKS